MGSKKQQSHSIFFTYVALNNEIRVYSHILTPEKSR